MNTMRIILLLGWLSFAAIGCGSGRPKVEPPENPVPPLNTSQRVTVNGGEAQQGHRQSFPRNQK